MDGVARSRRRRLTRFAAVVAAFSVAGTVSVTMLGAADVANAADPIATVPLGAAAPFAVLTAAAVGNTATGAVTTVRGDLGAGGGHTGFPPGVVTGAIAVGGSTDAALDALDVAYADAQARTSTAVLPATLGGNTAGPGVHTSVGAIANTGTFTIDAGGTPGAVFIFQVNGALAFAASSHVVLTGGAQAKNVFWVVTGAGALGAGATFVGTMMASAAIDVGAGVIYNGRALSQAGAITMTSAEFYGAEPTVSIDGGAIASTVDADHVLTGDTSVVAPDTVTVTIDDETLVVETLVVEPDPDGSWTADPVGLLADGTYTVVAFVDDGAGNYGSFSQQLTVDTIPPDVTIDGATSQVTNDLTPTLSGTTDIATGERVVVTMARDVPSSAFEATTLVQSDHTWNVTPNTLSAGVWEITATVADPAGNTNAAVMTLDIDVTAPVATIDGGITRLTSDASPTITGTAVDAHVLVWIDGLAVDEVTQVGPLWSAEYTGPPLTDGTHRILMIATDAAGNTTSAEQTLTVDTVDPLVTITPGAVDATNDVTPTIVGTTDVVGDGVTVSVSIDGAAAMFAVVQFGVWNVTPTAALNPGPHDVVATVVDAAGNVGTATQVLTIDVTPPVVTIAGGTSRSTADATPTVAGSIVGALPGSTVRVEVAGRTLTTTVSSGNGFSVTPASVIADGTYVVDVTARDPAGNIGRASQSLTIRAIAPDVAFDGGASRTTSDTTPLIAGSTNAPVGSAVTVTVASQTLRATVQPGGLWFVVAAQLAAGKHTLVTDVTDLDGNSGSATQALTVASTPPVVSVDGGSGFTTDDPTPPITGSDATPGSTVVVTVGGETLTTTVDYAGNWSVTPTDPLPSGAHEVTIAITSPGGATGTATQVVTVTAPSTGAAVAIVPVDPARFLDTRAGSVTFDSSFAGDGRSGADQVLTVQVAGRGEVPADAVGVVVNLTAISPGAPGFATLFPCGSDVPNASHVNYFVGDVVANNAVVPLNASGEVCIFTLAAADFALDVNGYVPGGSPVGLFAPARFLDTREGEVTFDARSAGDGRPAAGTTIVVQVAGRGAVPAGADAVMVNLTAVFPDGPGFATVFPCGGEPPDASTVNYFADTVTPNGALTKLASDGSVCVFTSAGADLVLDVAGFLPAGVTSVVTQVPERVLDSRSGASTFDGTSAGTGRLDAGAFVEVKIAGRGDVPSDAIAAVLNVAVVFPDGPGFVTLYPCGDVPTTSSLNHSTGATVRANNAVTKLSASGTVCVFTLSGADLILDLTGYVQ